MILERLLDEFTNEMLDKFKLRRERYPKSNVLDDKFDWVKFPIEDIERHFISEFFEHLLAKSEKEKMDEDVDVANCAFLDWAMRKARRGC